MVALPKVHPARMVAYRLLAEARREAGLPVLCVAELNAMPLFRLVVLTQEARRKAEKRNGAGLFDAAEERGL